MEWIILALAVLCIVMSGVAMRYRRDWQFEKEMREIMRIDFKATDQRRMDLENWCEELRQQLPKRDSRGRFCKRNE